MSIEEMQALLAALLGMRYAGVRSVNYDGNLITYGSDAELAAAIADLERRLSIAVSGSRSRISKPFATRDL